MSPPKWRSSPPYRQYVVPGWRLLPGCSRGFAATGRERESARAHICRSFDMVAQPDGHKEQVGSRPYYEGQTEL